MARTKRHAKRTLADRIYTRLQGGVERHYLDARSEGAGRIALSEPGERWATPCPVRALALAAVVWEGIEAKAAAARRKAEDRAEAVRRARLLGLDPDAGLGAFADHHLAEMAASGRYSKSWLDNCRRMLGRAVDFFDRVQPESDPRAWRERGLPPGPRNLASISTPDVGAWMRWLATLDNGRGGKYGEQQRLHHLAALSFLYRRAKSEGRVSSNPVADLIDRPQAPRSSTKPHEAEEVALLLEAARLWQDARGGTVDEAAGFVFEMLAVLAYAGVRWGELRGLRIEEVRRNLPDGLLEVYTDADRSVKTGGAVRSIPIPSHLVAILTAYLRRLPRLTGPLFGVADAEGEVRPVGDARKTLASVARLLGWRSKSIRPKRLRVSYATHYAAVDGVTVHDLRDAMGHTSLAMLAKVYGRARRRRVSMGPELDFTVGRYADLLSDRLAELVSKGAPATTREEREQARREEHAAEVRVAAEQRADVVRRFVAATAHLSAYSTAQATGIDRSAIRRARAAIDPARVHAATVERMAAWLAFADKQPQRPLVALAA